MYEALLFVGVVLTVHTTVCSHQIHRRPGAQLPQRTDVLHAHYVAASIATEEPALRQDEGT